MNARRQVDHLLDSLLGQALAAARDDGRGAELRVHDVRTNLKRARALLELVHPLVGRRAHDVRRSLATVARSISFIRDSFVLLETFDRLAIRPRLRSGVRARLEGRRHTLDADGLTAKALRSAARALRATRRRATASLRRGNVSRAIAAGFVRSYRIARRAMKAAYRDRTPEAFHAWRKAVKVHAFHVAVLDSASSDRVQSLDALGTLLGNAHDLAVLERSILEDVLRPTETRASERLLASVRAGQREIYGEAEPLGKRLFAARPKRVLKTLTASFRPVRLRDEAIH